MNKQVCPVYAAIDALKPEQLSVDDRLALIELLRRCLTAGPESEPVASNGPAA